MVDDYYALYLDDPATPGFCSFSKLYIGAKQSLISVSERMIDEDVESKTGQAINSYFAGNSSATHNIAYQEIPVLTKVQCICSSSLSLPATKWDHRNIWGFPYAMRFEAAKIEQIVVLHDEKYIRCIRAWMHNLQCEFSGGEWHPMIEGFWGNRAVLNVSSKAEDDFVFNNLLFIVEDEWNDLSTAEQAIQKSDNIIFDHICEEIFADG